MINNTSFQDLDLQTFENKNAIKNIIFDLDGTLVESSRDIIESLHCAYDDCNINISPITEDFIGPPLEDMVKNITPHLSDIAQENILKRFRYHYDSSLQKNTILYNGLDNILDQIKENGINIFIATYKPLNPTEKIVNNLQLDFILDIYAPDKIEGKLLNKSEMIADLINKWNLDRNFTVMVGDSPSDIIAAQSNNIKSLAVLYGYGNRDDLLNSNPNFVIKNVEDYKKVFGFDIKPDK